jgi:large repetitive protein
VLFDNTPAPLVYGSDTQIRAVVPYEVDGSTITQLRVSNQGVMSDPAQLNVTSSTPAIFTVAASGKGGGAVLNQDNTLNTRGGAVPSELAKRPARMA